MHEDIRRNAAAMTSRDETQGARLLSEAVRHHQAGNLAQAQVLYRSLLDAQPDHPQALDYLGLLSLQTGRPLEALELVERAIGVAPRNPGYRFNLARVLLALRRVDDAIAAAETAVETEPASPAGQFQLGQLYLELRRDELAVAAFERATELRPEFAEAFNQLGVALEKLARHGEAAAAYRRVLELEPDSAETANNLGNVLQSAGAADEAFAAYRVAAELNPGSAEVHANIGHVQQRGGRITEAMSAYARALERDPQFTGARYLLATAHLELGDAQTALREVQLCLDSAPHHQEAIALKGICLRELGRDEEARRLVDLDQFVRVQRLEAPSGYRSIGQFNRELQRYIVATGTLLRDPVGASTRGGRHSADLMTRPRGPIAVLKGILQSVFRSYLQSLPVDPSHPFLSRSPLELRLVAQANILDSKGFLVAHIHPYAWVSGAYYVRIPREVRDNDPRHAGWLEIGKPPGELSTTARPEVRHIRPEEGSVVLFPSYFYHGTIPFEGTRRRFSLGLDVLAEG